MSRCTLLIVVLRNQCAAAESLRDRIRNAWPAESPINVQLVEIDRWHEAPASPDAIVAIVDSVEDRDLLQSWLNRINTSRLSVLVICKDAAMLPAADPVLLPIDAGSGDELLLATLRGVMHRNRVVREVQNELCLIERFHGGLESQLNQMHEELQLAAMVQREFIPSELPSLHGVGFGALWRPANYVSGDLYAVTKLDEDHLGVFLADAVGHGVPAALMTMVISRSLVMHDEKHPDRRLLAPSEVLRRLNNRLICQRERSTRFVTGVYALVDCRSRTMRLAGAGHPPPLLGKADGTISPLQTDGGLLGIFRDEIYNEIEVELELDDRVLFYSDGFEVAFPSASADRYEQRLPSARYMEEFTRMCTLDSPLSMIEHLQRRVDSQRGSLHQVDDLTLVCLHAGPIGVAATGAVNRASTQSLAAS